MPFNMSLPDGFLSIHSQQPAVLAAVLVAVLAEVAVLAVVLKFCPSD